MRFLALSGVLSLASCGASAPSPEIPPEVLRHIDALGADDPEVREAAARRLVAAADAVRSELERASVSPESEVALRAREVLWRREIEKDDARRRTWKEKIRGIQLSWDRAQLYELLDQVRPSDLRWPVSPRSAGYSSKQVPMTWFDLHSLDDTFNLHVIWNGEEVRQGIRSVDVVGFPDLRRRIAPDLYDSVAAIHRVHSSDPVLLIRAVNALQPLGKEHAVRALYAYDELVRALPYRDRHTYDVDEFRIRPVVELLFEDFAGSSVPEWLRLDLTVEGDIPFHAKRGPAMTSGPPPEITPYLVFAASPGSTIRAKPLRPTGSPIEAVQRLIESKRWSALGVEGEKELWAWRGVPGLALGALWHLFPAGAVDPHWDCCKRASAKDSWRTIVETDRALGIGWDPARQDFVKTR